MSSEDEKILELKRIVSALLHEGQPSAQGSGQVSPPPKDLHDKLAHILARSGSVQAGHVQLIGLKGLKDRMGDQWPEKRTVVLDVLQSIISRRLSPQDVFFQKSEDEFIIVFAKLGAEAAKFVCARILQELNLHFLGNASMGGVTVKTAVGIIDGGLVFETHSLKDMLKDFKEVDAEMADTAYFRNDVAGEADKAGNWSGQAYEGEAVPRDLPRGLSLVYRPMWDVKREVIATYTIDYWMQRGAALVPAYQAVRDEKSIRAMDVSLLRGAIAQLKDLFANNLKLLICVPLHYETVLSPALINDYVRECGAIPLKLRRYVLFACDQFPAGVPESRLSLIAQGLKPYCRAIGANVNVGFRDFAAFSHTGFSITGCYMPGNITDRERLENRIRAFVDAAHAASLTCTFLDVHNVDDAAIVHAAGADFIEGQVIRPVDAVPGQIARKTWQEIAGVERV